MVFKLNKKLLLNESSESWTMRCPRTSQWGWMGLNSGGLMLHCCLLNRNMNTARLLLHRGLSWDFWTLNGQQPAQNVNKTYLLCFCRSPFCRSSLCFVLILKDLMLVQVQPRFRTYDNCRFQRLKFDYRCHWICTITGTHENDKH